MWKAIFTDEVLIAIAALTLIACVALGVLKADSKEIIIQVITAVAAFVTGRATKTNEPAPSIIDNTVKEIQNVPAQPIKK